MNYFDTLLARKIGGGGGGSIAALVTVSTSAGAIVEASDGEGKIKYSAEADNTGTASLQIKKPGTYTLRAKIQNSGAGNWIYSDSDSVTVPEYGGQFEKALPFITLSLTVPQGSTYTLTDGTTTYTGTSTGDAVMYYLPNTGTWTASCTDGEQSASQAVTVSAYTAYTVDLSYVHVYGVIWDKTQTATTLTRTDDAASFANPDPYVADGNHPGSSPFDNIWPWSGMVKETLLVGGMYASLVKIPKFWYKIENTSNSLKIQIADDPKTGFKVSPAHRARNANETDRDYVYIGRYKCGSGIYGSLSDDDPVINLTRSSAREQIHNYNGQTIRDGVYQQDFAMFWTIRLLYIVEFANWDSQAVIGYGCGDNRSRQYTGASDSMPYHTGTMQKSRTTYGVGCQYRWIEDLWGNVGEWCDGIRFSGSDVYIIDDPANFSDTAGGVKIGTRPTSSGFISNLATGSGDHDWALYPSAVSGGEQTYIADYCDYGSNGVTIYVGGYYYQDQHCGMFFLYGYYNTFNYGTYIGTRLMYLPPQT